ncbi:MAG: hypothetical protein ACFFCI_22290 [Promethearchaeota archaeon]
MRDLKEYFWTIPIFGIIICIIAFLTPAAVFENPQWNHTIVRWIWGLYYDELISIYDESVTIEIGFYDNPSQLLISIISSVIIIICIIIVSVPIYRQRTDLKNILTKPTTSLIPAILIIISMISWMIVMEIAEFEIYNLSMWNRYIPIFGVVGPFIGAGLIIIGYFINKKSLKS